MASGRWTWVEADHPRVAEVFDHTGGDGDWCDALETSPADAVVGKVLCVCAALEIARHVTGTAALPANETALTLLAQWIDDPTTERFEEICSIIFDEDGEPDERFADLDDTAWWALRTATSSVGNYEAGWALQSLCSHAASSGRSAEELREIARIAVLSRKAGPR